MKRTGLFFLCVIMVAAGGCAKKEVIKPEASVMPSTASLSAGGAVSNEKPSQGVPPESAVKTEEIPAAKTTSDPSVKPLDGGNLDGASSEADGTFDSVYFDYDSHLISLDSRDRLKKNADLLRKTPRKKLVIEGHCDERGSDDYNMALGQKRAQAAVEYLRFLGIDTSRLSSISYGEEKPAVQGHDEATWSKNRRDEFHWQ